MKKDIIFDYIAREKDRQRDYLAMIPSENYASAAVREAVGSVLMNKYSEGQVGKRYYQGNVNVDAVEGECKRRALKAFRVKGDEWGVNVQALSGSPANLAVYNALLEPGDKIMAMYLPDGGHLSHGWQYKQRKVTLVSKIWDIGFYHVDRETQVFDYDEVAKQAKEFAPKLLISGGTAYPRDIDHERMGAIAKSVGAYYMADVAHEAGLIVGGAVSSPLPHADVMTMTTHKTLRGPRGAIIISRKALSEAIDKAVFPGMQGGPHNHTIAGIAVALGETQTATFRRYTKQVVTNAQVLAEMFSQAGFEVVSGGTDKHLVLLDLRKQWIFAWAAAWALEYAGIVVNYNTVPNDSASPMYPSGLRMGTPAITTRGIKVREMKKIGAWMIDVLEYCKQWPPVVNVDKRKAFVKGFRKVVEEDGYLRGIRKEVTALSRQFPVV